MMNRAFIGLAVLAAFAVNASAQEVSHKNVVYPTDRAKAPKVFKFVNEIMGYDRESGDEGRTKNWKYFGMKQVPVSYINSKQKECLSQLLTEVQKCVAEPSVVTLLRVLKIEHLNMYIADNWKKEVNDADVNVGVHIGEERGKKQEVQKIFIRGTLTSDGRCVTPTKDQIIEGLRGESGEVSAALMADLQAQLVDAQASVSSANPRVPADSKKTGKAERIGKREIPQAPAKHRRDKRDGAAARAQE